jgi:2-polyprenyl-3-methyl-5-hydroxy-6-metoxy-1,4-benzoquinol methylase
MYDYGNDYQEYESTIDAMDHSRITKSYEMLADYLESDMKGNILDIGCLAGKSMLPFLQRDWNCYGIELSNASVEANKRGIVCKKADVSNGIPFDDDMFDIVWAEEIIEHILDTDYFLSECCRVLKKGGVLIISTPNLASLMNRLILLAGRYPRYVQYSNEGAGHVRYFTKTILNKRLEINGFTTIQVKGNFLSLPDPTKNKSIRRAILAPLGDMLPGLSENLIFVGKKQ